jgi:kynurenine formamidase
MTRLDLSHPIASGMPMYPDTRPVVLETASTVAADGARATDLDLQTHAGTHIDAPAHMREGAPTLDDLPLDAFTFTARCVDCTHHEDRDPITPEDLPGNDAIADVDLLAVHTGWSTHWGTDRYRDHPYLTRDAATWCADHDLAVGIDAFSPDPTPSTDPTRERASEPDGHPAHHALFDANQCIVENLTDLDQTPDTFQLHAHPLPITDADGSPIRAIAEY